ncbi:MAG: hypothetical protein QM741_12935 [Rudaea sp.]
MSKAMLVAQPSASSMTGNASRGTPSWPLPAIVVMMPEPSTLRIRWFEQSAMYRLPALSMATASGLFSCAVFAAPPSPEYPALPVPATAVIVPPASTLRTMWSVVLAM